MERTEDGGTVVKSSELINMADGDLADRIAKIIPEGMQIINILSTLCRVVAYVATRTAPSFESVEATIPTISFMIVANARIIWEMEQQMKEGGIERTN